LLLIRPEIEVGLYNSIYFQMSKKGSKHPPQRVQQVPINGTDRTKELPAPFSLASKNLTPFFGTLDKSKVYIVHLDTLPSEFKRKIFAVPILMNLVIAALLLWRAYATYPTYLDMLFAVLGQNTNAVVTDADSKPWLGLMYIVLRRTLTILIDFVLVRFILPWPVSFFFEAPANPISWRRNVPFQNTEIIVRASRKWGTEDLNEGVSQGEQNPFFRVRIMPAIDKTYVREKTGYLMMGKDWDLDFASMILAHRLVKEGKMTLDDFQKTVLVHSEDNGWMYWPVHHLDEGSEDEARKKILAFKVSFNFVAQFYTADVDKLQDRLTMLGKENVFFRWIELIQYETTQPGGFTPKRQADAVKKARQLFEEQGIDFEEFLASVGGVEAFPGLEQTS